MGNHITNSKHEMRERALRVRKAISDDIREQAAREVANKLCAYLDTHPHSKVAGYWPMGSELNLIPTLEQLIERNIIVGLPTCALDGHDLIFKTWKIGDPLSTTSFGFLGPSDLSDGTPLEPDLYLVPVLAFDRQGVRLGRGKGHYDQVIAHARSKKQVTIIGIAFSVQEFDALPQEPHDEPLDLILTEKEWISIDHSQSRRP